MFGAKKLGEKLVAAMINKADALSIEARMKDGAERYGLHLRAIIMSDMAEVIGKVIFGESDD